MHRIFINKLYYCTFRDGCDPLFANLHQHDVPLLIFSAGLGDIITEAIQHQVVLYDNIKIVANFMKFDKKVSYCNQV